MLSEHLVKKKKNGTLIQFQPIIYNWIYLHALMQHPEYHEPLLEYHAFTDIEFNPKKSLNCQAYAAALFCLLYKNNLLEETMKTPQNFLSLY